MTTQISPADSVFAGRPWTTQVVMPTHYTDPDGTTGAAIDWTAAAFVVTSKQTPEISLRWDLPSRTVTLSLTGAQVARVKDGFRWYLGETVMLNTELYSRRVDVEVER